MDDSQVMFKYFAEITDGVDIENHDMLIFGLCSNRSYGNAVRVLNNWNVWLLETKNKYINMSKWLDSLVLEEGAGSFSSARFI